MIDTPGMRNLLMGEEAGGIGATFEDIEKLTKQCRFSDCRHGSEPGCAVKKALTDGILDERHWNTYLSLQKEQAYSTERRQILMKKAGRKKKH